MRDIESFTELYYRELLRTPTGKDPVIRKFMDRWNEEEAEYGNLINRFLNEAGHDTVKADRMLRRFVAKATRTTEAKVSAARAPGEAS